MCKTLSEIYNIIESNSEPYRSIINESLNNGIPKYIKLFDNGGATQMRYAVVFTEKNCYITFDSDFSNCYGRDFIDTIHNREELGTEIDWNCLSIRAKSIILYDYLDLMHCGWSII